MLINKTILKKVVVVKDILCNNCGSSLKSSNDDFYGLPTVTVSGGYNSTHLEDNTKYEFALCEKCLKELFAEFKFQPTITKSDILI